MSKNTADYVRKRLQKKLNKNDEIVLDVLPIVDGDGRVVGQMVHALPVERFASAYGHLIPPGIVTADVPLPLPAIKALQDYFDLPVSVLLPDGKWETMKNSEMKKYLDQWTKEGLL